MSARSAAPILVALAWVAPGCGRTEVYRDVPDAGSSVEPVPPPLDAGVDAGSGCVTDASCADQNICTVDTCAASGQCEHAPLSCDDGNWCRVNFRCDPVVGCVSDPRECGDGISCHHGRCDAAARACVIDLDPEQCAFGQTCGAQGCVWCTSDAQCEDGIGCTTDSCLPSGVCSHTIDDQLCPAGLHCGPTGCGAWAYAVSVDTLYDVEVHSHLVRDIGPLTSSLNDIAFSPDGVLYGAAGYLFAVDRLSAAESQFGLFNGNDNALDFGPDGTLYGAGLSVIEVYDFDAGTQTQIATLPNGWTSSGDIAFVGGQFLVSCSFPHATSDILVRVDLDGGVAEQVGDIGYPCVFGLAAFGEELFGFTCEGHVISIDTDAGTGSVVFETGLSFYGASSR